MQQLCFEGVNANSSAERKLQVLWSEGLSPSQG